MSDSDIVQDFLVESYENLDRLDRELVGLEKNPHDRDALASVFRTIHTIKGTCGFLGFNKLEKVAHVGENLLTRLRDGQLTLNPELTTALLGMVDAVRQMLKEIQSTGQDGEIDYPELREILTRLQQVGASAAKQAGAEKSPAPEEVPPPTLGKEIAPAKSKDMALSPGAGSEKPPKALKLETAPATVSGPSVEAVPVRAEEPVIAKQEDIPGTRKPWSRGLAKRWLRPSVWASTYWTN
jgi:two-component system chemotaxis sensor kinase CheA